MMQSDSYQKYRTIVADPPWDYRTAGGTLTCPQCELGGDGS